MTLEISQVMCFGKSLSWYDLLEKIHVTLLIFLIRGQYVHLPNLVQIVALCGSWVVSMGEYLREALVSMSLRLRSLLNPITVFSLNSLSQSGLLLRIFQFLWINCLILGLHGLKLVTMTGVVMPFLGMTSNSSSWVNLDALL